MGKTRDLVKKPRYQGNISCKDGYDRGQKRKGPSRSRTHEEVVACIYKKGLNDPDNHNSVVTHLEPDNLECEVKRALGNITMNKASGDDGIPVELIQMLKDTIKWSAAFNMSANLENMSQDWKRSAFIQSQKKALPKNFQTNAQLCSFQILTS